MSRGAKWHQGRVTPGKLHLIYVEGGGHGGGVGLGIHPPPIKATNDITKTKNGVGKTKEGGGCAWREAELRGC